jgi:hypothetical protein
MLDLGAEVPRGLGEGRAASIQPLQGDGLLPAVGSPGVRNVGRFSSAPELEGKAHRSTIMPPLPPAMARNGCDLSDMLKYKDLYLGVPVPTLQYSRSSAVD